MLRPTSLVYLAIGKGTDKTGDFSSINWGSDIFYLKLEIDPAGGTSYNDMGTTQLLSVPYALSAKTVTSYTETDPNAVLLTGDQIVTGNKTFSGTTSVIAPVNATDAANKAYVDNMLSIIQTIQTGLRDVDGNTYKVILIGNQLWMEENLKTTKYNDGTTIPNITLNVAWVTATTGAYCDYSNTPSNSTTYGRLYNWCAVDNNTATKAASYGGKNVCPTGWHVPSDLEWTTLTDYLTNNGYGYEGSGIDIAKSMASTSGWDVDPTAGNIGNDQASNNGSGFTALPGGYRGSFSGYSGIGFHGYWWSSTVSNIGDAYSREMFFNSADVIWNGSNKVSGLSVRCLRD